MAEGQAVPAATAASRLTGTVSRPGFSHRSGCSRRAAFVRKYPWTV